MVTFPVLPLTGFTFLNLFGLQECLVMWLISMPVIKFNCQTLLHQGLSEPEFYGDLIYKFKKLVSRVDFSDQFKKIIVRYKHIGYNINILR